MFCIFLWYCWWGCSFWACCGSGGSIMSTHPSPGATACPVSWSNCLSSRRGSYQLEEVELAAMWWNNTTFIRTYIGNNTEASFFKCFQLFTLLLLVLLQPSSWVFLHGGLLARPSEKASSLFSGASTGRQWEIVPICYISSHVKLCYPCSWCRSTTF